VTDCFTVCLADVLNFTRILFLDGNPSYIFKRKIMIAQFHITQT